MSSQKFGFEPGKCRKHSEITTSLKCSRCGDYICVKCVFHSPVGVRCPKCAKVKKIPTFEVTKIYLLRAVVTAMLLGVLSGFLLVVLGSILLSKIIFLDSVAIFALAYVIGESVSLSVNRKRGKVLRYIAIIGVVTMYSVVVLLGGWTINMWDLLAGGMGIYVAIAKL